jgi:dihydrofolate synthase/folylpolyglutamate synthase
VPTVSGVVDEEPARTIEAVCQERGSRLVQLGRDFRFDYRPPHALDRSSTLGQLDYHDLRPGHERSLMGIELLLLGKHQAANAAVAIAALAELESKGWNIPEAALRRGLAEVAWPARVEVVARRPTVIIDAAHNIASIEALVATLGESFAAERRILVFATTREKDVRGMLELLLPHFDCLVLTRYTNNPRNVPAEELRDLAVELGAGDCRVCPDPASAWELVHEIARGDDLVCITGSFFLAGEMRLLIESRPLSDALNHHNTLFKETHP